MKRWLKVLLGVMAHWLFLYLPMFFLAVFGLIASNAVPGGPQGHPPTGLFVAGIGAIIVVHFLSILLVLVTMGLFIAHAALHPRHTKEARVVWVLLLAFMGVLASPVYYWLHLFTQSPDEPFFGKKESA
jgi:hypothetical protein